MVHFFLSPELTTHTGSVEKVWGKFGEVWGKWEGSLGKCERSVGAMCGASVMAEVKNKIEQFL